MEQWQYEHIVSQIHRTSYKRHENFVLGALIHDEVIGELLVFTQHYVRFKTEGYALVDIFYPQLNIAIEVDEPLHQNYRESDKKREQQLKETLACDVIRIDVASGNVNGQVEVLREELVNRVNQLRSSGKWKPWTEPPSIPFDKLRENLKETMFVKIRGEIHPENLMERQTGYWYISDHKRKRVQQVVVVHNGVVSRVFGNLEWKHTDPIKGNRKKWGYTGIELTDHDLVGTIVVDWPNRNTRRYSTDLT